MRLPPYLPTEEIENIFKRALVSTINCLVSDLVIRGLDTTYILGDAIALKEEQGHSYDELVSRYDLVGLTKRLVAFDFEKVKSLFPFYRYEDGRNTSVFPAWYYALCNGKISVREILDIIAPNIMHPFYECLADEGYYAPDIYKALNDLQ